jgi:hypothetical protein
MDNFFTANELHDIKDALGYIPYQSNIQRIVLDIQDIHTWEDYKLWGKFRFGELANLEFEEIIEQLASYRRFAWAKRAIEWVKNKKMSPIIIVDGRVKDGRGRINVAVGVGWQQIEAISIVSVV